MSFQRYVTEILVFVYKLQSIHPKTSGLLKLHFFFLLSGSYAMCPEEGTQTGVV